MTQGLVQHEASRVLSIVELVLAHLTRLENLAQETERGLPPIQNPANINQFLRDGANRAEVGRLALLNILRGIRERPIVGEMICTSEDGSQIIVAFLIQRHQEINEWQRTLNAEAEEGYPRILLVNHRCAASEMLDQDVGHTFDEYELEDWSVAAFAPAIKNLVNYQLSSKISYFAKRSSWAHLGREYTWNGVGAEVYISLEGNRIPIPDLSSFFKAYKVADPAIAGDAQPELLGLEPAPVTRTIRRSVIEPRLRTEGRTVLDPFQSKIKNLGSSKSVFVRGTAGTGKTTTLAARIRARVGRDFDRDGEIFSNADAELQNLIQSDAWVCFSPTQALSQQVQSISGAGSLEKNFQSIEHLRRRLGSQVFGFTAERWDIADLQDDTVDEEDDNKRNSFATLRQAKGRSGAHTLRDRDRRDAEGLTRYFNMFFDELKKDEIRKLYRAEDRLESINDPEIQSHIRRFYDSSGINPKRARLTRDDLAYRRNRDWTILERINLEWESIMLIPQGRQHLQTASRLQAAIVASQQEALIGKLRAAGLIDTNTTDRELKHPLNQFSAKLADDSVAVRDAVTTKNFALFGTLTSAIADNVVSKSEVRAYGRNLLIAKSLAHLRGTLTRLLNETWPTYQRWRSTRRTEYNAFNPDTIDTNEFDLLILLGFKISDDLIRVFQNRAREDRNIVWPEELRKLLAVRRHSVFVDEAPDFTILQLGYAAALTPPRVRALFCVGDFAQRNKQAGLANEGQLRYLLSPRKSDSVEELALRLDILPEPFENFVLDRSYRQSRTMNQFASRLRLSIDQLAATLLTVHAEEDEISPILAHVADLDTVVEWLASRIREIRFLLQGELPSIAVFVPDVETGQELATRLTARLPNDRAQFLPDFSRGENDMIRVFKIGDFKGLEFEAAFLVGLDVMEADASLQSIFPELVYVAASRAATFFGVTYAANPPRILEDVQDLLIRGGWADVPDQRTPRAYSDSDDQEFED
jgi:hypothetical protein